MKHQRTARLLAKGIAAVFAFLLITALNGAPLPPGDVSVARQLAPVAMPTITHSALTVRSSSGQMENLSSGTEWIVRDAGR